MDDTPEPPGRDVVDISADDEAPAERRELCDPSDPVANVRLDIVEGKCVDLVRFNAGLVELPQQVVVGERGDAAIGMANKDNLFSPRRQCETTSERSTSSVTTAPAFE